MNRSRSTVWIQSDLHCERIVTIFSFTNFTDFGDSVELIPRIAVLKVRVRAKITEFPRSQNFTSCDTKNFHKA